MGDDALKRCMDEIERRSKAMAHTAATTPMVRHTGPVAPTTGPGSGQGAEWVTIGEACRMLATSVQGLFEHVHEGRLVEYRFGKTQKFKRADIEDLAEG